METRVARVLEHMEMAEKIAKQMARQYRSKEYNGSIGCITSVAYVHLILAVDQAISRNIPLEDYEKFIAYRIRMGILKWLPEDQTIPVKWDARKRFKFEYEHEYPPIAKNDEPQFELVELIQTVSQTETEKNYISFKLAGLSDEEIVEITKLSPKTILNVRKKLSDRCHERLMQ